MCSAKFDFMYGWLMVFICSLHLVVNDLPVWLMSNFLHNNSHKIKKYNKTGVYKLTCSNCNKFYIGQTGRPFTIGYNKHRKTINHPYIKSNFAEHILSTRHKYTNIQIQILHKTHRGPKLNTLEQLKIYKHHKTHKNKILNAQTTYDHILYNITK